MGYLKTYSQSTSLTIYTSDLKPEFDNEYVKIIKDNKPYYTFRGTTKSALASNIRIYNGANYYTLLKNPDSLTTAGSSIVYTWNWLLYCNSQFICFRANGSNNYYIGKSTDDCSTWSTVGSNLYGLFNVTSYKNTTSDGQYFYGTFYSSYVSYPMYVKKSSDGATWTTILTALGTDELGICVDKYNDTLLIGTTTDTISKVYSCTSGSANWNISTISNYRFGATKFTFDGDYFYLAGGSDGSSTSMFFYKSIDAINWTKINTILPFRGFYSFDYGNDKFIILNDYTLAGTSGAAWCTKEDFGNWNIINISPGTAVKYMKPARLKFYGGIWYATFLINDYDGILYRSFDGINWEIYKSGIEDFACAKAGIFGFSSNAPNYTFYKSNIR